MTSFILPWNQILICLLVGFISSLLYLGLLWLTIKHLAKSKHKGLLLFLSAVLRVALFLVIALLCSQHNPARLLWIVVGFVITRLVCVSQVKTKEKV